MNKKKNRCEWYLEGFCCRDLDSGRVWDCVIHMNPKQLLLSKRSNIQEECEYFIKGEQT